MEQAFGLFINFAAHLVEVHEIAVFELEWLSNIDIHPTEVHVSAIVMEEAFFNFDLIWLKSKVILSIRVNWKVAVWSWWMCVGDKGGFSTSKLFGIGESRLVFSH
jgi:hypothetical protein